MKELNLDEVLEVSGSGLLGWIVPVAVGFIFGGPAGVVAVIGTYVATRGVNNFEHLVTHHQIPSVHDSFGV